MAGQDRPGGPMAVHYMSDPTSRLPRMVAGRYPTLVDEALRAVGARRDRLKSVGLWR
jgi:hypothetical protein